MPARTAVLTPALPTAITSEAQLPRLPDWYPLDPKPGEGAPYTSEQRAALRRKAALGAALQGPYDGQRMQVQVPEGGEPPARFTPLQLPTVWYTLDRDASNPHQLVYRYDPTCWLHPKLIGAVEDGFREFADPQYAQEAREDDQDAQGYQAR